MYAPHLIKELGFWVQQDSASLRNSREEITCLHALLLLSRVVCINSFFSCWWLVGG
jgi:hypothetical protein